MEQFGQFLATAQNAGAYRRLKKLIASRNPKHVAAVRRANDALINCKDVAGKVTIIQALTSMSVQYKNEDFIGVQLMPVIDVSVPSAEYFIYTKRDRLATPDDSLGKRSTPNELTENRSTATFAVKDYGLMDFVSDTTIKDQSAPLNELVDATACVNDAMGFREEKRLATVLTTAANYAGNTVTLAGGQQWSDYTNSDPIGDIETAVDSVWQGMGPTRLMAFTSQAVWRKLRHHTKLLAEFKHVSGLKALAPQQVAEYFGLDGLLIAKAWEDTANEGQTAVTAKIWGKFFGIVRVAQNPGIRTAAFGYTFRKDGKQTTQWYDPKPGTGGGYYSKVGLREDHKVVAGDTGYLVAAAVA